MFLRVEPTCCERLLVDRSQRSGHDLSDAPGAEVLDEVGHVVGTWWWPVHGHYLGGPGVATPWTQTDDRAAAGHEPFDTGNTGTRQPDRRLGDATRGEGFVDGGSFGPDVDSDRV